jgi:hypothetical protein
LTVKITKIFELIQNEFLDYIKTEFEDTASQLDILIDIIIRDGNCIMSQVHLSKLYEIELKKQYQNPKFLIENDKSK